MEHAGRPIPKDFPDRFETERLLARCPLTGDGPELFAAVRESCDELKPWMPWVESHKAVEDSEESARRGWAEFLERSDMRMYLFLKGTNTLVGSSGPHRIDWSVPKFEIGYWCRTSFAGQGYITEAAEDPVRLPESSQHQGGRTRRVPAGRGTPKRGGRPGWEPAEFPDLRRAPGRASSPVA